MVQFAGSCLRALYIQARMTRSRAPGYPIRPPTDQWVFAPPRRFSQLAAAFVAGIRQGIRRKPCIRLTILPFPGKAARMGGPAGTSPGTHRPETRFHALSKQTPRRVSLYVK